MPSRERSIGSDPEFMMVARRKIIPADTLFASHESEVGCDGCSQIGELRPQYTYDPEGHVENIKNLLSYLDDYLPSTIEVRAGSAYGDYGLGGHIHIGKYAGAARRGTVPKWFINSLDSFVGIPTMLNCHSSTLKRRLDRGYGRMGNYRPQPWGMEYRTPSSWLVDPISCRAALALTKMVSQQVHPIKSSNSISSLAFQGPDFYFDREAQMQYYLQMKQIIEEFNAYDSYKDMFLPMFKRIESGKLWMEREDALVNWGFRPSKQQTPGPLTSVDSQPVPIRVNKNDKYCEAIGTGMAFFVPVYVYGISKERSVHLAVHVKGNAVLSKIIASRWRDYSFSDEIYGAAKNEDAQIYIGLSREVRRDIEVARAHIKGVLGDYAHYYPLIAE